MRKKVFGRQFSRSRKAREALFKSLIKALILHGKIGTTYAKAKAIQGDIDRIVILAKEGSVASSRRISAYLSADRKLVAKIIKDTSSFKERTSGFTRIVRLPSRMGDAAQMAKIEWTDLASLSEQVKSKKDMETKKKKKEKIVVKAKDSKVKKTKQLKSAGKKKKS